VGCVVARPGTNLRAGPHWLLALAMLSCPALTAKAQTLSANSIHFGNWVVQTTSAAETVILSNTQAVPLTISSITTSGDFAQTSTCPIAPNPLAAGAKCKITVTFKPTALGTRTGTLTVNDNASNSPQTAQLGGTGVTPVGLTPNTFTFANQVVNTTSAPQLIIVANYQTVPLTIAAISVSGDFTKSSNCPISPNTLAARSSCNISVTFTPTTLGPRSGSLALNDSAPNAPQTAQLSGSGVPPAALSLASVAFGNQVVNTTSLAKSITLLNYQTVPLTIAAISAIGDFAQTSNCPISPNTLAPGASCKISVTFTPTVVGARTGTLTVNDDASNSPQTAQLSGSGVAPVILSTRSVTFGSQVVSSTSAAKNITLKNNQQVALTIGSISASSDYAQTSNCPLTPNTLAAGSSCTISVTFTPSALGTQTGTLSVTDNASTSPQAVSLSGTGSLSGVLAISVTPANTTVLRGNQQQLVATGIWQNGSTVNIGNFVIWVSSAPSVVPVSSSGLVQAVARGLATITATYGSVSGSTTVTVPPPALTSITVIPANSSVPVGGYEQFTAVLNYDDGGTKDATSSVTWSSSAATVATLTSSGLASALAEGSTTITAASQGVTGSTTITVSQPQCIVPPLGLIGWWTGDRNLVDIAENNSGALQNGATYGSGEVGQAFSFAGNGASVLIPSSVYSPTAGTLMFWFMPTDAGSLTGSYDGTNRTPGLAVDANGNLSWEFGDLSAQVLGQISLNQWSHAALTYSTSNSEVTVNVYLNGNLAASAIASPPSSWYPQVAFGAYLGAQKPSFTGSMDEVAIFNQALSAQQIQQIYNAFSAGMCKPTLQSIAVTPANPSLAPGTSLQFGAVGTYSDSTNHDLTTSASWSTSDSTVATVNASGLATAAANGSATVSAFLGSENGSTTLTVAPQLVSIQVNPQNPSSPAGIPQSFTATGTFTDGSQHDLSNSVSWSSSGPAVATIASNGLATCLAAGQTTITATAGSVAGFTTLTAIPATLSSITVSPANPSIVAGSSQQFTATGTFSDGSQHDLTNSVSWGSSAPAVAMIAFSGLATGVSAGQATITANSGSINNFATLTVTSALLVSITVNPVNPSVLIGNTQPFTATGTYSDGSQQDLTNTVGWSSSNANVASIDATGLALGVSAGITTISATFNSTSGFTTLTVTLPPPILESISVTPANPSVAIAQNQQFIATGQYGDGSQQDLTNSVVWSSTQPAVASISSRGLASGVSGGSTTINATLGSILGSATLNVSSVALVSITVTPASPSIALGTNQQFAATATYADGSTLDLTNSVTWNSSPTSVATINATGLASSVSTGQANISATSVGISGFVTLIVTSAALVSITVTPALPTIPLGTTAQFAASGTFTDGTMQDITTSVQWSSSSPSVATISNASGTQGQATSLVPGTSTISAVSGSILGSATLAVGDAALVSITVSPASPSIALGTTQQFTAAGTFTDGSQQDLTTSVAWSSGSTGVATLSSTGLGTSLSVGTAMITATLGAINGSTLLTVTPATVVSVTVNPATTAVPLGINPAFTAQGTFTDGSQQDVTNAIHWSSSVPGVATVSNSPGTNGLATSVGSGSTVINARSGSVAGSSNLTVTNAIPAAIEISPQGPSIQTGGTQQFTATGLYTDGTTANISTTATWASSSATVATISNTSGSQGLAASAGTGTARISASLGSLTASTTLTVQDQLVSISIAPASSMITPGAGQQFTATGTSISGVKEDLTSAVLWNSSKPAVATIGSGGLAMSFTAGQATITASLGSVDSSASLGVTAIQHVVVIFQENRTPDNLFQDPNLIANGADIASSGINSKGQLIPLQPVHLVDNYGMGHAHLGFLVSYDNGKMDGFNLDPAGCLPQPCTLPPNAEYSYVYPSDVAPYFQMAERYTFGDRMFQTNQGPSFPAHQFIISGTSAPTATSDLFAAENTIPSDTGTGCRAASNVSVALIDPEGNESQTQYPCFEHLTLPDLLDAQNVSWRYYTPNAGTIWTGPNAIQHLRLGPDWANVIIPQTQVLSDITNGSLPSVSWVIPSGQASDHPAQNDGSGPSWVASVVNAIGTSPYWANTAIFITWDDWGGWYDHVAPAIINSYEYGFRVPLIVVSPYAKPAYISHVTHDFGSILKFIEKTYNLPSLGYADTLADDLSDCFNFGQTPLSFLQLSAPLSAEHFLNDKQPPADPDDD
jgi:trimeric autotransporter adhesin